MSEPAARTPLYYAFGNHMHWVDMQWLWGAHVLPGSVEDMLALCREAGVKGCVNFDGIGYEKLASEAPESLARLRQAVKEGIIEPVGCSYGQPYGQFHGAESNLRQRIFGVRAVRRLLGVVPRTFWEEEFDFFPQLPQILRGVGIEFAALFYQWTWHTPEVPKEEAPAIWWEGVDGSRILAASRNRLNVHQWPEDMDAVLGSVSDTPADSQGPTPVLLQWLELMPSPDWMCRSELILPKLREMYSNPNLEVRPCTLAEYLEAASKSAADQKATPVRRYGLDDVWHGLTLGKNGDRMRRLSIRCESQLLAAESLASLMGFFGRPYAQWDVYPTWELEESWRELLAAQHHDNDECEGLCGHVGRFSYDRSMSLSGHVLDSNLELLAGRVKAEAGSLVVYNPLGWVRNDTILHPETGVPVVLHGVPPLGYRAVRPSEGGRKEAAWRLEPDHAVGTRGDLEVLVRADGLVEIGCRGNPTCSIPMPRGYRVASRRISEPEGDLVLSLSGDDGGSIEAWIKLPADVAAVDLTLRGRSFPRPEPGFAGAIRLAFEPGSFDQWLADSPYAVSEFKTGCHGRRKYPTGDWMTSPQWFEEVHGAVLSNSLVCGRSPGRSLLLIHDGSQQWFLVQGRLECVLTAYDPWDEDDFFDQFDCSFRIMPGEEISATRMWRAAQEFRRPLIARIKRGSGGDLPSEFSLASADGATLTALYREPRESALGQEAHVGDLWAIPYVARLVNFEGTSSQADMRVAGTVARAVHTNLLGEPGREADLNRVDLGPAEIATISLDIAEGRKHTRDLDAKREVWATIHR